MSAAEALSETFAALGAQPASVPDLIIAGMALQYGAPFDVGPATPWHEVGTDICRTVLLDEVESHFAVDVSDNERERIRTLGDLIRIVERGTA